MKREKDDLLMEKEYELGRELDRAKEDYNATKVMVIEAQLELLQWVKDELL